MRNSRPFLCLDEKDQTSILNTPVKTETRLPLCKTVKVIASVNCPVGVDPELIE
jgi:hypothetical protein